MLKSLYFPMLFVLIVVVLSSTVSANVLPKILRVYRRAAAAEFEADDESGDYFLRSAKWVSKMNPGGGSLVSGRGGFRPGFVARDWRHVLAEPNFVKRSYNDY